MSLAAAAGVLLYSATQQYVCCVCACPSCVLLSLEPKPLTTVVAVCGSVTCQCLMSVLLLLLLLIVLVACVKNCPSLLITVPRAHDC
jgi:hypothetical protein